MTGTDEATDRVTGRAIALIVLLLVAGAAVRGYLPATEPVPQHRASDSPMALAIVAALIAVSLGILAVAFIDRVRNRRATAGNFGALTAGAVGSRGRPSWRVLLIGLAVVSAWLLIVWLAMRLAGQHRLPSAVEVFGSHGEVPGTDADPRVSVETGSPQPSGQHPGGDAFGYLMAGAVAVLALIFTAVATAGGRGKPAPTVDEAMAARAGTPDAGETLVRAAELGLAEIADPNREPRAAIIACYATMERQLGREPDVAPREFDTPTEVLARAVDHHALPADNAARLVNLFTEARFSPHLMTERHRADAVAILRVVLDELRRAS